MSHFRQKSLLTVTALALLATAGPGVTAQASLNVIDYPGLKTPQGASITQSAPFSAFTNQSVKPVLDWRTPSYVLKFDVPDMNWTSSLRLSLSADPVGDMSRDAEIYVQFNQSDPIKVTTKGRGFDAFLSLETAKVRPRNNVLKIFYGVPASSVCLQAQHGAWVLNLEASKLTLQSRAKSRDLSVGDLDAALSNPLTVPDRVSLRAFGDQESQFHSLLAQAVGLRIGVTPDFDLTPSTGDIEFIAGRRDKISNLVQNKTVMQASGPRLALEEGRPMRVILTGDTDKQVLELLQAFARHRLPETRRALTSTGELRMQPLLSDNIVLTSGRTNLADMGPTTFNPGKNPENLDFHFDVEDPVSSQGDILLRLTAPASLVKNDTSLRLSLNGQPIGQTSLDKSHKSVVFPVPPGVLQGQDNILSAHSERNTNGPGTKSQAGCPTQGFGNSGLSFGKRSRITLNKESATPLSDLSRLSATGAPFSDLDGNGTLLVLPKADSEYRAALGLLSDLALKQGGGWSEANVIQGPEQIETLAGNRNILLILPVADIPAEVKSAAPKSFQSALTGKPQEGDNLLTAQAERYASTLSLDQDFAMKTALSNRINNGGVAALFASPYASDKLVGIITTVQGENFKTSLETLSQPSHWNRLEGSVARWNENSVLMTELSSPLPHFIRSVPTKTASAFQIGWPELDYTRLTSIFSDIQLPSVDWTEVKEKVLFWEKDKETENNEVGVTTPNAEPELRGLSVAEETRKFQGSENNGGWIKNKWSALNISVSNWDLRENVSNFQTRFEPLRSRWRANLDRSAVPAPYMGNWSLQQISAAIFLLILFLGFIIVSLGLSTPQTRTKRRR